MEIAFEIHNTIGPGFTENIYEAAFVYEPGIRQLFFEQQKPIHLYYKSAMLGLYRLDRVVDQKIIVELKAVCALNDLFKQQIYSYLKASGLKLGLIINFGGKRVEQVRVAK